MSEKKANITLIYSLQQFTFWAGIGGVVTFAATYLLGKGFTAAQVGWILFGSSAMSFLLQPVVASYVDRAEKNALLPITMGLASIAVICLIPVIFLKGPSLIFALLYLVSAMALDMQIPLQNSIIAYYSMRGWKINYGLGRGVGSAGFAVATLTYGYMIEKLGPNWMLGTAMVMFIAFGLFTLMYPKDESRPVTESEEASAGVSLGEFFGKYKWYCISLFGTLFLAMFHIMTENYLIEIMRRFGGDSTNVGINLFIATAVEAPGMVMFPKIREKIGSAKVMIIAGAMYIVKALIYIFTHSIGIFYAAQTLQCVTYVFLSGVQMYYAEECTDAADMVKGQSMITAFYTLGCALGNLLGGSVITGSGVQGLLYVGGAMTVIGMAVILVTVPKALSRKH